MRSSAGNKSGVTTFLGLPVVLSVFVLMVPESAGILIPSEATLIGAGVAAHEGLTTPAIAILAAGLGNLVGAAIAYEIGRRGVMRRGRLGETAVLIRSRELIRSRGNAGVFWSRLLPIARTFASFPAGDARLPVVPFAAFTLIGSLIWAVPFVIAGDVAGDMAQRIGGVIGWVLLAVGVAATFFLLRPRETE